MLRKGQRIVVKFAGKSYELTVLHTEPANTISILGNVDLEASC